MFDLSVRDEGGTTVLTLSGAMTGSLSDEQRARALAAVQPGAHLVLDLAGLKEASGS